ncbi:MAG: hypothetical protein EOP14_02710 [Pseudomonas sp.]|nr:MAG: hypothetical protein EOP14_02710 [Pseudomonas sp.]
MARANFRENLEDCQNVFLWFALELIAQGGDQEEALWWGGFLCSGRCDTGTKEGWLEPRFNMAAEQVVFSTIMPYGFILQALANTIKLLEDRVNKRPCLLGVKSRAIDYLGQ